jgi:hypothetical protein
MKRLLLFTVCVFTLSTAAAAQTETPWGYSTGYGNVYGTFGLAQTMQTMYNVARAQAQKRSAPTRTASGGQVTTSSNAQPVAQAPRAVKNYGKFVPDPKVDTGKVIADALGDSPEERQLITKIYTATKTTFDKEAAARGWRNNIAGGLTFFTATAVTVYNDSEEPSEAGSQAYYEILNATYYEIPEFKNVSNRDKQNFNNMTIGFAGLLLATYVEGKQTGNADTLAASKKLAGMLIKMVLKTDPENIKVENGQIVMK